MSAVSTNKYWRLTPKERDYLHQHGDDFWGCVSCWIYYMRSQFNILVRSGRFGEDGPKMLTRNVWKFSLCPHANKWIRASDIPHGDESEEEIGESDYDDNNEHSKTF
jgi:hypothetical protein